MKTTKFKPSEVGPVPVDWEVRKLGELFDFKNGYNADAKNYGRGTPVASVLDALAERPFKASSIRARVSAPPRDRESFSLKRGDLIFTRSSETLEDVGRSNVYDDEAVAMFGGFVIRGRPKTDNNSTFINLLLKTRGHRDRVMSQGAGAQHYNIGQSGLERVLVSLPPLPEQKAVAEALSDVDGLLAAMTKLIEKKHAIKQGAMQQLLTGKTRLPGFKGKWVEKRLGEIGISVRGVSFKPDQSSQSAMPNTTMLLRANNVQDNRIALEDVLYVQDGCIADSQRLKDGDILICAANGSRNLVGKAAIWKQPSAATFGAFMAVFRCNEGVDSYFVGYLFQSVSYRRQLDDILTGSAINNLNAKDIEGLAFVFPVLAEQQAIAAVLSDMDAEIAALEAEHAKYESIKQGMMQELLTGRTRLM